MTERSSIFEGATPYGPDIHRLNEAFPEEVLTEGALIPHQELEEVVRVQRGTQRYYGVINAWIARLKSEKRIFLAWNYGRGLQVLDPAGVLNFADTRTFQKIRQTGRAIRIYDAVDRARLDDAGQRHLDHQNRVRVFLKDALLKTRRDLASMPSVIPSNPRPPLPEYRPSE